MVRLINPRRAGVVTHRIGFRGARAPGVPGPQ